MEILEWQYLAEDSDVLRAGGFHTPLRSVASLSCGQRPHFAKQKRQTLHPYTALRCRVLTTKPHTKNKKADALHRLSCFWQGQEDSNPRPTVLEWLCASKVPLASPLFCPFCSPFRQFKTAYFLFDALLML